MSRLKKGAKILNKSKSFRKSTKKLWSSKISLKDSNNYVRVVLPDPDTYIGQDLYMPYGINVLKFEKTTFCIKDDTGTVYWSTMWGKPKKQKKKWY